MRAQDAGVDEGSYLDTVGYLILRALECFPVKDVRLVLRDFMGVPEQKEVNVQSFVLRPVLDRLVASVRDACTRDCVRVSSDPRLLTSEDAEQYWNRLRPHRDNADDRVSKLILVMEDGNKPCKVGFKLDRKHGCPLLARKEFSDNEVPDLKKITTMLRRIVRERLVQRT